MAPRHTDPGIIRKLQRSTLSITALRYGHDERSRVRPQFNVHTDAGTAAIILSSRGALGWWVEATGYQGITTRNFSEFATIETIENAITEAATAVAGRGQHGHDLGG